MSAIDAIFKPGRRLKRGEVWCFEGHEVGRDRNIDFHFVVSMEAKCGYNILGIGHAQPGIPTCEACRVKTKRKAAR